MSMLKAIQAVQAFQDKKWVPDELEDWSFFSQYDVWHYISVSDDRRCWNCEQFDGMDFYGDELRGMFPDLQIINETTIEVRVHLTLWGKETCRCKLIRVLKPKSEVPPRILKGSVKP